MLNKKWTYTNPSHRSQYLWKPIDSKWLEKIKANRIMNGLDLYGNYLRSVVPLRVSPSVTVGNSTTKRLKGIIVASIILLSKHLRASDHEQNCSNYLCLPQ